MSGEDWRRLTGAAEDAELQPLFCESRPLVGEPGVMLGLWLDEGQQPITAGKYLRGRLTVEQALGLARDLELMVEVSRLEHGPAPIRLDPGLPVVALRWIESVVAEFPGDDQIPLFIGDRTLTLGAQDCPQLRDAVSEVVKRAERWRDDRI